MRRVAFAIPGDVEARTGGYGYDRRLIAELPRFGWAVDHLPLAAGFPRPDPEERAAADAVFSALPDGALLLVDGLALGVLDTEAERQAARVRLVGLCHHPLALETGLAPGEAARFAASERRALAACRAVIATSAATAATLRTEYGVPPDRIAVAPPGTERIGRASGAGDPPVLLALGTVTRRKGHDLLVAALERIRDLAWTCRIVGDDRLDPDWTVAIRGAIAAAGLGGRIVIAGRSDDPSAELLGADLFVLPSRYEGYGMAFAEALACGLPVVACRAGAVPDVVPEEAGALVPVDDVVALADALRRLVGDRAARRRAGDAAYAAGAALPSWQDTARLVALRLDAVAA